MFLKIIKLKFKELQNNVKGALLLYILVFGTMFVTIIGSGLVSYALIEHKATNMQTNRDLSFHIAEAGINYYQWVLAHDPTDFQDGTGDPGPYVHDFFDQNGNVIGQYSLSITPPEEFRSVIEIISTGYTLENPSSTRSIKVLLGSPSITNFSLLTDVSMEISPTTNVSGEIMSNTGIKFDGTTNAMIRSARETYTYQGTSYPGVWGGGGPNYFFTYPVPAEDFNAISVDLAEIRDGAIDDGLYLGVSGEYGWQLIFQPDETIDIYQVEYECWFPTYWWGWYNYDICGTVFQETVGMPDNGVIFSEEKLWVQGTVAGQVTVAAAQFPESPSTYQDIVISDNLLVDDDLDGDKIGLIAQGSVNVPFIVPSDMTIQAAVIAQHGNIWRPGYINWWGQNYAIRNSLTFIGSQISANGGWWKYGDPVISGFVNTNHVYDSRLRLDPPPGFPVDSVFEVLSWEEVRI